MITGLLTHFATCSPGGGSIFFPTWYRYLGSETVAGKCTVIFNFPNDLPAVLLAVVEILLRAGAFVAVGFILFGGFRYITSRGEPDATKAAQGTIINALIGLVITILSTAIVSLVAGALT